jgi:uncharacterized protein YkwD
MEHWCTSAGRGIAILLLLTLSFGAQSQDDIFKLWPDSTLAKANSARSVTYMSEEEKLAVYYINLVRINPPLFTQTFLKDYLESNDIKKDKEIKDLIHQLEETAKMNLLSPNEQLTAFARKHATDMGETGRTGHSASDGTSFLQRIKPLEQKFGAINENCNYGNEGGIAAVIDLLIDRNVPNFGHRRNILDPEMELIGVAIEPHRRWRFNCVQDFGSIKK